MNVSVVFVIALVACVTAAPRNFGLLDQGRAIAGFGAGVAAVPSLGLGGGVIGLATGGPRGALTHGARGARQGAEIAQLIGGQYPGQYNNYYQFV